MTLHRRVTVLGATGSVGASTLDLMVKARDAGSATFEVEALVGARKAEALAAQAVAWGAKLAVVADEAAYPELKARLQGTGVEAAAGEAAVLEAARRPVDFVMAAIVGAAGLKPTWTAAETGAVIGLANKESLVCCGPALLQAAAAAGGSVIPVDSEHSAIFQVLQAECRQRVAKLVLTASGGPFRTWTREAMAAATPEQAVAHPNWSMGAKISVDSATLTNKGLEMIEASYLFDTPEDRIDVLVHPQSIIHSMVEYQDGSTLAQLGPPDMRTPIACALAWPDRLPWPAPALDLAAMKALTFEAPDTERFPALDLARESLRIGAAAPAAFNAANEAAVQAFLDRKIGFLDIAAVVADTLDALSAGRDLTGDNHPLERALAVDAAARRHTADMIARKRHVA